MEGIYNEIKAVKSKQKWIEERKWEPFEIFVVGNKSDLKDERVVSTESGKGFADEKNLVFAETSVKTGENVEEVVFSVVRKIRADKENQRIRQEQIKEKAREEQEKLAKDEKRLKRKNFWKSIFG